MKKQLLSVSILSMYMALAFGVGQQNLLEDLNDELTQALGQRNFTVALDLVQQGANPHSEYGGYGLLHLAAEFGTEKDIQDLLSHYNLNVNQRLTCDSFPHKTPAMCAVEAGNLSTLKALVAHGSLLTQEDGSKASFLLHDAVVHENPALIEYLIKEHTLDPNMPSGTGEYVPLHTLFSGYRTGYPYYIMDRHNIRKLASLRVFMEHGANINAVSAYKESVITRELSDDDCLYADMRMIRAAFDYGLNFAQMDDPNHDALLWIIKNCEVRNATEVLSFVLRKAQEQGIQPADIRGASGETILHAAVCRQHGIKAVIKMILETGVDREAQAHDGNTAFMLAQGLHNNSAYALREAIQELIRNE